MDRALIRLEVIKLTYTHGRDSAEAVYRARELENYIFELQDESLHEKKKSHKAGNSKNLSDKSQKDALERQ